MPLKTLTTAKFVIPLFNFQPARRILSKPAFLELARKNIVKKKGVSKNLSKNIDKIVYGI